MKLPKQDLVIDITQQPLECCFRTVSEWAGMVEGNRGTCGICGNYLKVTRKSLDFAYSTGRLNDFAHQQLVAERHQPADVEPNIVWLSHNRFPTEKHIHPWLRENKFNPSKISSGNRGWSVSNGDSTRGEREYLVLVDRGIVASINAD